MEKREEKMPTAVEIQSNFVPSSAHFEFQFDAPHQVGEHSRLSSKLTRSLINTERSTCDQFESRSIPVAVAAALIGTSIMNFSPPSFFLFCEGEVR